MNIKLVLGALGLDPEKIEAQLDAFTNGVPAAIKAFDERMSRVEQNQVITNRLLEELINGTRRTGVTTEPSNHQLTASGNGGNGPATIGTGSN